MSGMLKISGKVTQKFGRMGRARSAQTAFVRVVTPVKGVFIYFSFSLSEGRRHDAGVLADSGLLTQLQLRGFDTTGSPMCAYHRKIFPKNIAAFLNGNSANSHSQKHSSKIRTLTINVF